MLVAPYHPSSNLQAETVQSVEWALKIMVTDGSGKNFIASIEIEHYFTYYDLKVYYVADLIFCFQSFQGINPMYTRLFNNTGRYLCQW